MGILDWAVVNCFTANPVPSHYATFREASPFWEVSTMNGLMLVDLLQLHRPKLPKSLKRRCYTYCLTRVLSRPWWPARRLIMSLGFTTCILMLAFAYYLQYYRDLQPCSLCILQRLVVVLLSVVFLAAAWHNPCHYGAQCYGRLIAVLAGLGAGMAGYQVWLQYQSFEVAVLCLPPLDYLVVNFPLPEVVRLLLASPGGCGEIQGVFWGLSIPHWTLLAFSGLGVVGTVHSRLRRHRHKH